MQIFLKTLWFAKILLWTFVTEMQFVVMLGIRAIGAEFISRLLHGWSVLWSDMYMCFIDLDKAIDRIPRKVMVLSLRQAGMPDG